MGKKLRRVQKGSNTTIAKSLLFIDIKSQPYIIGNKFSERVSSPVEDTLGSDTTWANHNIQRRYNKYSIFNPLSFTCSSCVDVCAY
jgi:hypothetical protein